MPEDVAIYTEPAPEPPVELPPVPELPAEVAPPAASTRRQRARRRGHDGSRRCRRKRWRRSLTARAIGTVVGRLGRMAKPLGTWRAVALLGRGGTAEVWHAVAPDGREAASEARYGPSLAPAAARECADPPRASTLLRDVAEPVASSRRSSSSSATAAAALVLEYLPHGDLVRLLGAPPRQWLPAFRAVVAALADPRAVTVSRTATSRRRNVLFAADGSARLIDLTSARPLDAPAVPATAAYGLPRRAAATAAAMPIASPWPCCCPSSSTARLPYGVQGPAHVGGHRGRPGSRRRIPSAARLQAAARGDAARRAGAAAGTFVLHRCHRICQRRARLSLQELLGTEPPTTRRDDRSAPALVFAPTRTARRLRRLSSRRPAAARC